MIAEFFDYHGAYVDYNCGLHKSEISLISLNKYADKTIGMVAEMIAESTFPGTRIGSLPSQQKATIFSQLGKNLLSGSFGVSSLVFRRTTSLR